MKKVIYNLLLIVSSLLSIYVIYIWLNDSEYNTITVEQKLLISASFLSVIGLIIVYGFQKNGVLNYKFVHFLLLFFSIAFLCGSSFLLSANYDTYVKRLKTQKTDGALEIMTNNTSTFQEGETQIYLDLKAHRNRLLGYETFLKETAQSYNANDYEYANVLKGELINQLANKAGTQTYWDDILNNVYVFDSINDTYKRGGYEIMYEFGKYEYPNEDLGNSTDMDLIRHTSIYEYWQAQLINTNRTPENIALLWKDNKPFIYTFFSKSQYDRLCKQVVDDLINIKEKINEQPNYQEFYENYDISDPEFLAFPDKTFVKSYEYSWPFSFWDRRFEEENDAVIYEILKEIQNHYRN